MTRAQWEALPAEVRRFVPWQEASRAKVIELKPVSNAGLQYFTGRAQ
jgi:hypothetical protein